MKTKVEIMKNLNTSYLLLLFCTIIAILGGKIIFPVGVRLFNLLILIGLSSFYFVSVIRIVSISDTKINVQDIISCVIFIFSSAFLAIFQFAKIPSLLIVIHIAVIFNGIYCYYLFFKRNDKIMSIKHLVFSILLMAVGIFSSL